MRKCTAETETRLVLAAEDSYLESRLRLHALEKLFAILGVAHRARRDDFDALDAELAAQHRHSTQRDEGVLDGDLAQHARLDQAGTQSRGCLHLIDDTNGAVGRDVRDRLTNRV